MKRQWELEEEYRTREVRDTMERMMRLQKTSKEAEKENSEVEASSEGDRMKAKKDC